MSRATDAGLRGRCPECFRGRLFAGWLAFADSCASCGADFSVEDAGDGPAVIVIFALGIVMIPMALAFHFIAGQHMWLTMLVWGPLISLAGIGLLRPLRGWMFAQQWERDAAEGRKL